jgi:hypothetical protein
MGMVSFRGKELRMGSNLRAIFKHKKGEKGYLPTRPRNISIFFQTDILIKIELSYYKNSILQPGTKLKKIEMLKGRVGKYPPSPSKY